MSSADDEIAKDIKAFEEEVDATEKERLDIKLAFESQLAVADIYFDSILSKLTPEQRIESARLMMIKYDITNPLLALLNKPSENVEFSKASYDVRMFAYNHQKGSVGPGADHGPYALEGVETKSKLDFVKAFKDWTGLGLKESKEACDCMPGVFAYGMDFETAKALSEHLKHHDPTLIVKIGIIN